MSSDDGCEVCGGLASNAVREHGGERLLCNACLDYEYPALRIGSIRRSFLRARTLVGRCPQCGWTQDQLEKTSLCGCPLCYEALDMRSIGPTKAD